MSKKILAILMAVAMAFSLLPVTVFAEGETPVAQVGETPYTSLDAAIEAAGDGATVKVLADCTTNGFNLSKNIILEGNSEKKPTITFNEKGIALWGKALTLDRHPDKNHFTKDMLVWPDNMDQTKWYYADMQEATNSHTYQMKENSDKTKYENWTKTLPIRNWEALEKAWSNANSSQGNGNVV